MTELTEEENARVELQVEALILQEEFLARKAAYTKVQEKLNRLVEDAKNRHKGYELAMARNATDANKLKTLQSKSLAETVACTVYLRVQNAVMDLFDKDSDEVMSKLKALINK